MELTKVHMRRWAMSSRGVLGMLSVERKGAVVYACHTLENPWMNNLPSVSCIPAGVYMIARDTFKGLYTNFKITDPPLGRSAIEFHRGNTIKDTEGCILVGMGYTLLPTTHAITNSKDAMDGFIHAMGTDNDALLIITDPLQTWA